MALALKTLLDKRKIALTRARFHAWWEGDAFDEAGALADIEAKFATANDALPSGADDALFEYELPGRLRALAALWGEGRIRPGDPVAEAAAPARLGVAADGVLAVLGPGLGAPIIALAGAYAGRIEAFEWREETLDALRHAVAGAKAAPRLSAARIDLEAHVFAAGAFDGLISYDDFAYCSYPPHLAQQIFKALKPGAAAIVECYVGLPSTALASAFASAFAEPQVRAHGDVLKFLTDAGLTVEADDDLTEACLTQAREGFAGLSQRLGEGAKLDVTAAQELAWEVEAWRTRMRLLAQRRLERRCIMVRKPAGADDQPGNTNAPQD